MIKFGTDGWRAVIGEDFTYGNVRKVARAHARVVKEKGMKRVLVGYDWRFSSEDFARQVHDVFSEEGLEVGLTETACTTPMVSFGVKYLDFDNGVMITASHNPPVYNGYKIKESFGGSATPDFIKEVESKLGEAPEDPATPAEPCLVNIRKHYISKVREWVNLELFNDRGLRVVHDAMHGTSSGLISTALENTRTEVVSIRSYRDPLFGGRAPEPVEKNLKPLMDKVRAVGADVGVANDGDGDRVALVDERGSYVNSQLVYVMLLLHLIRHRNMRDGIVVKTVSTTYLADRVCREEGVEFREVPVGFKHINEIMKREKVIFGGEESGGYGVPSFLPERDGLLSALLIMEGMILKGVSLSRWVEEIFREFGSAYYRRVDLRADERVKDRLKALVKEPPSSLKGRRVAKVVTTDGLKLVFEDESWILLRASGTEPLIRVYAEAPTEKDLKSLIDSGTSLLGV